MLQSEKYNGKVVRKCDSQIVEEQSNEQVVVCQRTRKSLPQTLMMLCGGKCSNVSLRDTSCVLNSVLLMTVACAHTQHTNSIII